MLKGKIDMQKYSMAAIAMGFVLLFSQRAAAQSSDVRVLASNGIKAVVEDLRPQYERSIGHAISIEYRPTAALKQEIEAGEPFDVVIVTVESVAQLSKEGKTVGGEGTLMSRAGVGIGIRKGAPRPDISTPEALKRALLGTKAIAYGPSGASFPYITKMLDTLGIADTMKAKTLFFDTSDGTNGAVA
jgi:molybdate transport system substrate-binding protein